MAKREKTTIKVNDTVTVVVTPTSRFTPVVEGYLNRLETLIDQRRIAVEHDEHRDAFVLLLQIEEVEDMLRTAYRRETFWAQ